GDHTIKMKAHVGSLGNQSPFQHVLRDHLGSVDTLIDGQTGAVLQYRGYDVFGRPRDIAAGNALLTAWQGVTKGYTDHEHLNEQQLIHMNGRIYDFNVGRFLSVDPFLQFPENSQSANPYSYILNNPMSGTDPTGYSAVRSGNASAWRTNELMGEFAGTPFPSEDEMRRTNEMFKGTSHLFSASNGQTNDENSTGNNSGEDDKEGVGIAVSEIATAAGAGSVALSAIEHITKDKALVPPAGDYKSTGQSRGLGKLEKVKWGKVNQISLKQLTESAKAGGGFLGVIAAAAATEANSDALSNGSISEGEFEGKRNADIAMLIVAMRGGTGGAVAGAVYYVADYVFSKDDVNGWIMLKRDGVQAMGNTQSSFQELGRDMKGIRREYDSDPNGFLHKLLSVQNISIGGG
ncbi:RHS repeat-associated core domain-containing protein, partial [Shewanella sp. SP1S1-7]|uniref:RHS repeat domain-containing protein n=1 Tax=Shewanella sp. SP1S1-7 TaxID=3063536 RepID=UPI00288F1581